MWIRRGSKYLRKLWLSIRVLFWLEWILWRSYWRKSRRKARLLPMNLLHKPLTTPVTRKIKNLANNVIWVHNKLQIPDCRTHRVAPIDRPLRAFLTLKVGCRNCLRQNWQDRSIQPKGSMKMKSPLINLKNKSPNWNQTSSSWAKGSHSVNILSLKRHKITSIGSGSSKISWSRTRGKIQVPSPVLRAVSWPAASSSRSPRVIKVKVQGLVPNLRLSLTHTA